MNRFSLRESLLLFVILGLALGWWSDRRIQPPATARFQMQVVDHHAFVLDTATGQVWERFLRDTSGHNAPGFQSPKAIDSP